jgi:hypothetical protein
MKRILLAATLWLSATAAAFCQFQPPNMPANSVWGRLGVPGTGGPSQAIPFALLLAQMGGSPTSRNINTTAPLAGGGNLNTDRTLSIATNGISNSLIRPSGALALVGNATNATANVADIPASAASSCVFRENASTIGCGSINLASSGAVGTSILAGANGGTNNAFMQFTGPAASLKTYALPNVSDTIAVLGQIQTWTGQQTFAGTVNSTGGFQFNGNAMTFPGSAGTLAALNITDQTLTGGANVTTLAQSTGNITIDCGARPIQSITGSTSAWTITAPSNDGSCFLILTNAGASAVVPTFSGFTVGTNTGAPLTTVASAKFTINIWRAGGTSGYSIFAHQ